MAVLNQMAKMEVIFSASNKHGVPIFGAGCGVEPLGKNGITNPLKESCLSLSPMCTRHFGGKDRWFIVVCFEVTRDLISV